LSHHGSDGGEEAASLPLSTRSDWDSISVTEVRGAAVVIAAGSGSATLTTEVTVTLRGGDVGFGEAGGGTAATAGAGCDGGALAATPGSSGAGCGSEALPLSSWLLLERFLDSREVVEPAFAWKEARSSRTLPRLAAAGSASLMFRQLQTYES
tara:strand:- start:685 stop:1143 length:459 start_codon:yes stop_codon:yes gene_type:complete